MKNILYILFLFSIGIQAQGVIEMTVQPFKLNDTVSCGGQPVFYINTLKWKEPDTNPYFISTLKEMNTLYPFPVFCWEPTGEVYILQKAYKKLVYPVIMQGNDVSLYGTCIVADIDYTRSTKLKILFKGVEGL